MKTLVLLFFISWRIFAVAQISIDSLKGNLLNEHNCYRKIANNPPLRWSDELQEYAEKQAHLIAKNPINYPHELDYGMNIYKTTKVPTAREIVDYWTLEQRYYDGKPEGVKNKDYPHYAQIIWGATSRIGCAIDSTEGHVYIIVCLYDPKLHIYK